MNRASLVVLTLSSMLALAPSALRAQLIDTRSTSVSSQTTSSDALSAKQAGISRMALVEHTRLAEVLPASATAAMSQRRARRGVPLMIVGGAAFLAGLIIGDDVGTAIAVGGAAIGLYGLYLWAQTQ
jgi:hypothetical protein